MTFRPQRCPCPNASPCAVDQAFPDEILKGPVNLVLEAQDAVFVPFLTFCGRQVNGIGDPIGSFPRFGRTTKGAERVKQQRNPLNEISVSLVSRHSASQFFTVANSSSK